MPHLQHVIVSARGRRRVRRRARARCAARAARAPLERGRHHAATTSRSGCTRRARPARRRARCTCTRSLVQTAALLREAVARHPRGRRRVLGGEAVLRLRPRQRAHVPARRRRDRGADGGAADAGGGDRSACAKHRPTIFCGVPTLFAAMLAERRAAARDELALRVCVVGRRGAARARSASAGASASAPTSSTASARPRCCTSSCRTGRATCATARRGTAGARLRAAARRRRRRAGRRRREGALWVEGPTARAPATGTSARESRATFHGPWTRTGDRYVARRRRLLHLRRPQPTTCSRSAASGCRRSRSSRRWSTHPAVLEAAVVGHEDARRPDRSRRRSWC